MVHELSVQAVKIKLTIFDPPARLINLNELASAIGAGYAAAGLPCPAASSETDVTSFRQTCIAELSRYAAVLPESLIFALQNYMPKAEDCFSEDSICCFKIGYEKNSLKKPVAKQMNSCLRSNVLISF